MNIDTDWSAWGWIVDSPRLAVMYHSVHYLDAMRYLFGDPQRVRSVMGRMPDQLPEGEPLVMHLLEYGGDLHASIDTNHKLGRRLRRVPLRGYRPRDDRFVRQLPRKRA